MALDITPPAMTADVDAEFDRVLAARDLRAVFQPVVSLRTNEVVGLEALARGPVGSALESPRELFAAARRRGVVGELDWACRATAFTTFMAADLPPSMSLFVNVEPDALASPCPPDLIRPITNAESLLRVVVEVNDRALAADPAGLIRTVDRARSSGWGVALDDVGSGAASLAVLPLVGADLVKLDLRLLRERGTQEAASITLAALRLVEFTGAALLVEGIETADDVTWAVSLGAAFGQGYHFGAPGPLEPEYPMPRAAVPLQQHPASDGEQCAPSHHLSEHVSTTMSAERVGELARMVYRSALTPGTAPVILASRGATRDDADLDTADYPLPGNSPLLMVLYGEEDDAPPFADVRTVPVTAPDPLARETFLVVLRDTEAVALAGWASQESGLVDVVLTQDTATVHEIARHLIARMPLCADGPDEDDDEDADLDGTQPDDADSARSGGWHLRRRRS